VPPPTPRLPPVSFWGRKEPEAMPKNSITDQSNHDASEYNKLNETIKAGLATFLEVGSALAEIRDRRLYRVEFETWDDYLEKKHGLKRQYEVQGISGPLFL
jgi:hypothetical protein